MPYLEDEVSVTSNVLFSLQKRNMVHSQRNHTHETGSDPINGSSQGRFLKSFIRICTNSLFPCNTIPDWFGLEEASKLHQFQPPAPRRDTFH